VQGSGSKRTLLMTVGGASGSAYLEWVLPGGGSAGGALFVGWLSWVAYSLRFLQRVGPFFVFAPFLRYLISSRES
jgi:hypothetical protein